MFQRCARDGVQGFLALPQQEPSGRHVFAGCSDQVQFMHGTFLSQAISMRPRSSVNSFVRQAGQLGRGHRAGRCLRHIMDGLPRHSLRKDSPSFGIRWCHGSLFPLIPSQALASWRINEWASDEPAFPPRRRIEDGMRRLRRSGCAHCQKFLALAAPAFNLPGCRLGPPMRQGDDFFKDEVLIALAAFTDDCRTIFWRGW